ncbi:MAG: type II toxin-antitoxin system VapB family antitoxin [Trueperaceae bacterium]
MALNIKNPEAHRLAQELAEATGGSITKAVTDALRDAVDKSRKQQGPRRAALAAELDAIAEHCAALPVKDARTAEEILGYDDQGLPG